ncbi:MAG: adenosylcobinamide amidohydrolase [Halofilum sp. (in: g-proteobacteria)]|nr:adenosylcobinamide amidohydrolase [Halofilum sp. (in: g-proteobacteria)]
MSALGDNWDRPIAGVELVRDGRWNALLFDGARPVLSSAPVNGGDVWADRVVNLCVDGPDVVSVCDDPVGTFAAIAGAQGWTGATVGLMTGVAAANVGVSREAHDGVEWLVLATVGFSNAHRAGGPAVEHSGPGTINVVAATSQALTAAARAEALALVAETKAAVLAEHGIVAAGGGTATGTGTDAVAIVGAPGEPDTPYTGYHTVSGRCLAAAVIGAMGLSMDLGRGGKGSG